MKTVAALKKNYRELAKEDGYQLKISQTDDVLTFTHERNRHTLSIDSVVAHDHLIIKNFSGNSPFRASQVLIKHAISFFVAYAKLLNKKSVILSFLSDYAKEELHEMATNLDFKKAEDVHPDFPAIFTYGKTAAYVYEIEKEPFKSLDHIIPSIERVIKTIKEMHPSAYFTFSTKRSSFRNVSFSFYFYGKKGKLSLVTTSRETYFWLERKIPIKKENIYETLLDFFEKLFKQNRISHTFETPEFHLKRLFQNLTYEQKKKISFSRLFQEMTKYYTPHELDARLGAVENIQFDQFQITDYNHKSCVFLKILDVAIVSDDHSTQYSLSLNNKSNEEAAALLAPFIKKTINSSLDVKITKFEAEIFDLVETSKELLNKKTVNVNAFRAFHQSTYTIIKMNKSVKIFNWTGHLHISVNDQVVGSYLISELDNALDLYRQTIYNYADEHFQSMMQTFLSQESTIIT